MTLRPSFMNAAWLAWVLALQPLLGWAAGPAPASAPVASATAPSAPAKPASAPAAAAPSAAKPAPAAAASATAAKASAPAPVALPPGLKSVDAVKDDKSDLSVLMMFTPDIHVLRQAMAKDDQAIAKLATNQVKRGEAMYAVLIFTNCKSDARGHCMVKSKITFTKPDGKATPLAPVTLWNQKAPAAGALVLGDSQLRIGMESGDPLGVYRLKAEVEDIVTKRSVVVNTAFMATP